MKKFKMINDKEKINTNKKDIDLRNKSIKKCGIIGVVLNLLLFGVKLGIGLLIHSVAVVSDAFNNLTDSLSSVVTLIGNYLSKKPADKEHPYGHGRFEYISSFVVSVIILLTGVTLFKHSISKILNPEIMLFSTTTIVILILSILVKVFIYKYNQVLGKKTDSIVLLGVAKDALSDILATTGIVISILVYKYLGYNLDGYIGVLVSLFIFKSGFDIAKESTKVILGEMPSEESIEKIKEILLSGDYVRGVHSLELHEYGKGNIHGSVHMDFPCYLIFKDVHRVADELEHRIYEECGVIIAIHMDPVDCEEGERHGHKNKEDKKS